MISDARHDFVGIIGKDWLYQIVLVMLILVLVSAILVISTIHQTW